MSRLASILERIHHLQSELEVLAALVGDEGIAVEEAEVIPLEEASTEFAPAAEGVAPIVAPAAPVVEVAAPEPKVRWRYVPGTWYRLVGPNPFRDGNNYNLFEALRDRYAAVAFSREQLGALIGVLARDGRIDTVQEEDVFVVGFLRTAGAAKGRIEMVRPPGRDAAPEPVVEALPEPELELEPEPEPAPALVADRILVVDDDEDGLPPEPGEVRWKLAGQPIFRAGTVNDILWKAVGERVFTRDELEVLVEELVRSDNLGTVKAPEVVAKEFLGLIADRGLVSKSA